MSKEKTQEEIDAITKKMHDDINSHWEGVAKELYNKIELEHMFGKNKK